MRTSVVPEGAPPPLRPPARAVMLAGFMAAGKTVVGEWLADRLALPLLDTDEVIAERAGKAVSDIFRDDGEAAFRALETKVLREAVTRGPQVVATGGGMMTRPENATLMRQAGPVVWLRVSGEEVLKRTKGDASRPLLAVADPAARVAELLEQRRQSYELADYVVDTSGTAPAGVGERVLRLLERDPRACTLVTEVPLVPRVVVPEGEYPVVVGYGLLARAGDLLSALGLEAPSAAIVTAQGRCEEYAERLRTSLEGSCARTRVVVVPDGEESKSLEQVTRLYEEFVGAGLDRRSLVFAVGGGMIGDLAGIAAATFLRGVRLVQVPTTVLAQIDSSVGGKTAVNLPEGKNLVGAFHQPSAVLASLDVLSTLPTAQLLDGLAEGIKHAVTFDAALFEWLEGSWRKVLALEPWAVRYFIARNVQIKARVVSEDPREAHLRAVLNFGHTVGHALERSAAVWSLSHGQAVAAGMVAELEMTTRLGLTEEGLAERVGRLLSVAGLPTRAAGVGYDRAAAALGVDKKIAGGRLTLPVVSCLGRSAVVSGMAPDALLEVLRSVAE